MHLDIEIRGAKSLHQYDELVKIFLQPAQYNLHGPEDGKTQPALNYDVSMDEETGKDGDRYRTARRIYEDLAEITGKRPKWGVLTGIRPVKLAGEVLEGIYGDVLSDRKGSDESEKLKNFLMERYLVHEEKAKLVIEILEKQRSDAGMPKKNTVALYAGIPFCPTRCLYCSFTSNQSSEEGMKRYVDALIREIECTGDMAAGQDTRPESIYMGGGTPTALPDELFARVLEKIRDSFEVRDLREFTVEAGRPDTIDEGKLALLNEYGIDRISINPQSMKQETLDIIGRRHTVDDIRRAYHLAREHGIGSINMDLIAGLPGEDIDDFASSLDEVIGMGPEKITLHTLAMKRASRMKEESENFSYRDEELRERMLAFAQKRLREEGYSPYYLYRQKYTSGNTENTGWCRNDDVGIYNIRIMDEHQSILALRAGGISKRFFPAENRLERIPNVSNYEIYIDRVDEMIDRKKRDFFIEKGE